MDAPTVAWIRQTSKISFDEYGYPIGDPDPLATPLAEAVPELEGYIGTTLPEIDAAERWSPLIDKAIRMLVEYNVAGAQPEILDTAADFDLIQSLSAASYSETRRSVGAARNALHPWPALDKLVSGLARTVGGGLDGAPAIGHRGLRDEPLVGSEAMREAAPLPFAPWIVGTHLP